MTSNYKKHYHWNPVQKFLINNFYKTLVCEAKKLNSQTVLDVGCGEGFALNKFYKDGVGSKLEGIDLSSEAVALGMKTFPHLNLKTGNINKLPYENDSFELLICTEVLEHLDHPETALNEIHRVTSKYCILSVPNEPFFRGANFVRGKNLSRFGNDIEHINHWSSKKFKDFIGSKFKVISVKTPFPLTLVVGEKNAHLR